MYVDRDQIVIESIEPDLDSFRAVRWVEVHFTYNNEKLLIVRGESEIMSMVSDSDKVTEEEKDMLFLCYPAIETHMIQMIKADMRRRPMTWAEKEEEGD